MVHAPAPDIRLDPGDLRPQRRRSRAVPVLAGALLGLVVMAAWLWWSQRDAGEPSARVAQVAPAAAPQPTAPAAIEYTMPPTADQPPLRAGEVAPALSALLGRSGVLRHLHTDDFPRRFAATVDNLGRAHAPPAMWPVIAAPGRFTVEERADGSRVIAASNARRYAPFVDFATSVDAGAAVQLYARMYPLLQEAYMQLGFPNRPLHDRVVKVVDLLLATPQPAGPVEVRLTEVQGPVPSTRPWVRYEFADPELEKLSAGQKMLLRMGPPNAVRVKQKLRELRAGLVQPPLVASPR